MYLTCFESKFIGRRLVFFTAICLCVLLAVASRSGLAAQRGPAITQNGMVASAHPLASLVGVNVLQRGGNAMDAVIAMAGALNVLDPAMTGLGGDMFLLYYSAREQRVVALNASGRAPYAATIEAYKAKGHTTVPVTGPLSITVPGALDGWIQALERYGTLPLSELLQPAIQYAEEGFPVYPTLLGFYQQVGVRVLPQFPNSVATYFIHGRPPQLGEILVQKKLARTLRRLAEAEKSGTSARDIFYKGEIGEKIVNYLKEQGGLLTMEDLASHTSDWAEPIATDYRKFTIYEFPPNSQGVALLQQLNMLEGFDLMNMKLDSSERIHLQVEVTKLALADLEGYVTDPKFTTIPLEGMLSKEYAKQLKGRIDPQKAAKDVQPGQPLGENTTYVAVIDREGNVASFINS
ncbi:MAG: gamma-glutamyltransferase family protein, partial [Nitrospira sp.]|nr:gamma-glutamyltransferase family protein [Nitrospira sp.]